MTGPEQTELHTKPCPACAEDVRDAALVCRFCGYDFRTRVIGRSAPSTNGFAIASLVLGIVWLWFLGSVLAVIFGAIAIAQINRSQGAQTGKGMAVAGVVLGIIGVVLACVLALLIVGGSTVQINERCVTVGGVTTCSTFG